MLVSDRRLFRRFGMRPFRRGGGCVRRARGQQILMARHRDGQLLDQPAEFVDLAEDGLDAVAVVDGQCVQDLLPASELTGEVLAGGAAAGAFSTRSRPLGRRHKACTLGVSSSRMACMPWVMLPTFAGLVT